MPVAVWGGLSACIFESSENRMAPGDISVQKSKRGPVDMASHLPVDGETETTPRQHLSFLGRGRLPGERGGASRSLHPASPPTRQPEARGLPVVGHCGALLGFRAG